MGNYIENPKTKGSGIICAIPQTGECPNKCADCFFQSGRSYLEPLEQNLPNMPPAELAINRIVRVNDGHDSGYLTPAQIERCILVYRNLFFNTAVKTGLYYELFQHAPFVLTINPGDWTDSKFHQLSSIPPNLMFVRIRTNTWNIKNVVTPAIEYYTKKGVPVVLTFMAYYKSSDMNVQINLCGNPDYEYKKRTLNEYWVISQPAFFEIMELFRWNPLVYSCGKTANEHACKRCGNCLREYFGTVERLRGEKP